MNNRIKTFYMQTFGCQMNVYDGQRISSMLRTLGATEIDTMENADLIILNTCAVRAKASDKVFSALGRIRDKKKPDALFGIVGCVAREQGANAFKRIKELNFVLGPQSYHKLTEILENPDAKYLNIDLSGLEKFDELPVMNESSVLAYIPIQEGCNHCCTYCIVPYTRGREISRPFDDVIVDVRRAAENGAVEICFLGQNANGYKYENYTLAEIIRETAKLDSVKRIKYVSSYPTEMTDELIDLYRTQSKLLPFLNMPIQSGSENILQKMNRPYSLNEYMAILAKLRIACPEIQISSDFIVGFPGESESDFNQSLDIIKRIKCINSYSYKYSNRPHTAAAIMPDQISDVVKRNRLKILDGLLNEIQREFNESCIGKTLECLLEGSDKTGTKLIYRSPWQQQVIIESKNYVVEQICNIKITSANKSSLRGEIVQ